MDILITLAMSRPHLTQMTRAVLTSSDAGRDLVEVFDVACVLMDERRCVDLDTMRIVSRLLIRRFYHEFRETNKVKLIVCRFT